jgi:hypothetical protein
LICLRLSQEYSEDSNSEPDVDLENQYYNSKSLKEEDPRGALQSFARVLELESANGEKGEWGFKALKQMIKIHAKLANYEEMMTRYKQLLTYMKSAVTRNYSEKSINSILDNISTSKNVSIGIFECCSSLSTIKRNGDDFYSRWFLIWSCWMTSVDGAVAKFLRNYSGCVERREERPSLVQNQYEVGQALLRSRGV